METKIAYTMCSDLLINLAAGMLGTVFITPFVARHKMTKHRSLVPFQNFMYSLLMLEVSYVLLIQ